MSYAFRTPLLVIALAACAGCQTHDRRIYSVHPDKNLHVTNSFSPSTTKAADDATASAVGAPITPPDSPNAAEPGGALTPLPPQ